MQGTSITKKLSGLVQTQESLSLEFRTLGFTSWHAHPKSQTVSGKSPKLSTLSRELLSSKIQTAFGQFRRRGLRNVKRTGT
jgi:hypothetical protein